MIHWNYLLSLEQNIIQLSNFIEFSKRNFKTYSIEILKLNLAIGSEIDVVMKQLCKAYNPECDFDSIRGYKIFLNESLQCIKTEKVSIPRYNLVIQPWKEIGTIVNDNFKNPFWWDNYNNLKHHRNSNYIEANLKNLLYSFGALILINLYYLIKINNIDKLRDTFQDIPYLKLYDVGKQYKIQILRLA